MLHSATAYPRMTIRINTIILATTMLCGGLFGLSGTAEAVDAAREQVSGIDVSRWQGTVDWNQTISWCSKRDDAS